LYGYYGTTTIYIRTTTTGTTTYTTTTATTTESTPITFKTTTSTPIMTYIATPPRTPMQGVMSSMWRMTFVSFPKTDPLPIMKRRE
jgi:hypothetical protein